MDRRGALSLHGRLKHPRYIAPFPSAFPKNGNNRGQTPISLFPCSPILSKLLDSVHKHPEHIRSNRCLIFSFIVFLCVLKSPRIHRSPMDSLRRDREAFSEVSFRRGKARRGFLDIFSVVSATSAVKFRGG